MQQATVRYCENCGQPLNPQARFCEHCGHPVPGQTPAPTPTSDTKSVPQQAASLQPAEAIVAALPMGTQRSGFLGMRSEGFVLVLTERRILVAKQTTQIMRENVQKAKQAAKESGQGFLGQWGAAITSNDSQRYLQMQPEEILNETAGNYSIANNQIRSVRIKEDYDAEEGTSEVKLTLKMVSGKAEFTYTQTSKKELKRTLQQTLGDLVR